MPNLVKNIVIGTTLADGSDEIVQAAFGLARASDATVHLVHAMPTCYAEDPEVQRRLFARLMEQAYRAGLEGIYFSLRVEPGQPSAVLESCAAEVAADLLVVGAFELGIPQPQCLGSTAQQILGTATRPVLLARGGDLETRLTRTYAGQVVRESATLLLLIPPGADLLETMVDLAAAA